MTRTRAFRRLVVALGASRDSAARIATWAALARRLEAELAGLFVEDVRLLHLAGYSFGVVGVDCIARPLDPATMERLLQRAADDARTALETSAAHHAVPCSFSRVRGDVAREIDANVTRDDLVVVEASAFGAMRPSLEHSLASVLYLDRHATAGRMVIVRAAEVDAPLIAVAAHLAAATGRTLEIVIASDRFGAEDEMRSTLDRVSLAGAVTQLRVHRGGEERVRDLVRHDRGAIVVARPASDSPGERLQGRTDVLPCSLLVVRRPAEIEDRGQP